MKPKKFKHDHFIVRSLRLSGHENAYTNPLVILVLPTFHREVQPIAIIWHKQLSQDNYALRVYKLLLFPLDRRTVSHYIHCTKNIVS